MTDLYKSPDAAHAVRERYLNILTHWPVANQQLRVPTREGETFIVACGDETAPPLLLFHGSAANASAWMADVRAWAADFRVYAVDMIGEPGLSAPSRPSLQSEAHALWLDDVMRGLSIERARIVGVSLGGWLALDYAIRRPNKVERLALLSPGGIGRQKTGILVISIPMRMLGNWGTRKLRDMILGRMPADASPAVRHFANFMALVHENFRPRRVKLPIFSDDALKELTMPIMVIVGGKDLLLDSAGTNRRLARNVTRADVRYLPEAGHFIRGQTQAILDFLRRPAVS
jgi:pimeloyl-ACP methyl ester carboxylesterase